MEIILLLFLVLAAIAALMVAHSEYQSAQREKKEYKDFISARLSWVQQDGTISKENDGNSIPLISSLYYLEACLGDNYCGSVYNYSLDSLFYFRNGLMYRDDGPAVIISSDGKKEYRFYLGAKSLTKEEWFNALTEEQKMKAIFNMDEWS